MSTLGFLGLSIPGYSKATSLVDSFGETMSLNDLPDHYPYLDPSIVNSVVGKSHSDLEAVKKVVDKRPEYAKSVWDWRYGDFESAIGAASHVGRRDIALYLLEKGARPTLFTLAMLGKVEAVKATIEASPGIQLQTGPHSFTLLDHAYAGQRMKDKMTAPENEDQEKTIAYLESLGNADGPAYLEASEQEKQLYIGDYKYGTGENEGFTVKLNRQKRLSLGPIGGFGGSLYKVAENTFVYNGATSVKVSFEVEDSRAKALNIKDPDFTLRAKKV